MEAWRLTTTSGEDNRGMCAQACPTRQAGPTRHSYSSCELYPIRQSYRTPGRHSGLLSIYSSPMINDVVTGAGLQADRTGFETVTGDEPTDARPGMAIVAIDIRPVPDPF